MLKVKSFDISNDSGINELLSTYRLAKDAHILVSEGKLCVPYEDGEPDNKEQKAIAIKEERNQYLRQLDLLAHSQKVLRLLSDDLTKKALEAEEEYKKSPNMANLEKASKAVTNEKTQLDNQILMNDAEAKRLQTNVDLFNDKLSCL